MLKRYALLFYSVAGMIDTVTLSLSIAGHQKVSVKDDLGRRVLRLLGSIEFACEEAGMDGVKREAIRVSERLNQPVSADDIRHDLDHLRMRVQDDLGSCMLLHVPGTNASFYETDGHLSENAQAKFSKEALILEHIKEAGNCFSLERYSGCVYHCVGSMDIAFKQIAKSLKADIDLLDPKLDWERILQTIESGVKEKVKKFPASWRKKQPLYDNVVLDLRSLRKVLRNPTAHYRKIWGRKDAEKVFRYSIEFLEDYAKLL